MRNISFLQILVLFIICFLLFGDLNSLKKKLYSKVKDFQIFLKNNKKRGT